MPTPVDFKTHWLEKFGLPSKGWRRKAEEHLKALAFGHCAEYLPLLDYLFETLPGIIKRCKSKNKREQANAYAWLCYSAWHGKGHFPNYAFTYASYLQNVIDDQVMDQTGMVISQLLTLGLKPTGGLGMNSLVPALKEVAQENESALRHGKFEQYLSENGKQKYQDYTGQLKKNADFSEDWKMIKAQFGKETDTNQILRRSLYPERNWGNSFTKPPKKAVDFQALFDLFCWKYCLWGMDNGSPLLEYPVVYLAPHGLVIIIPTYFKCDLGRDLNLAKIKQLGKVKKSH